MDLADLVESVLAAPSDGLRATVTALLQELGPQRAAVVLEGAGHAPPTAAERGRADLAGVAEALVAADDIEGATRPLLETLHQLTGMASTYLTVVDEARGVQEIRYALNDAAPEFEIPEDLVVAWDDTLCKRSLDEGRPCTTNVEEVWSDSDTAASLGIRSYVSVPVQLTDGRLWGTLCAADRAVVEDAETHLPTMTMFARLIAAEIERATALRLAQREADVDELTGCATRRAVERWLGFARDSAAEAVAAAFVDLNGFKQVNDSYGHAAGDAVLARVGEELRLRSRQGDLVGRLGGDEFVVVAALLARDVPGFVRRWSRPLALAVPLGEAALQVSAAVGAAVVPARRARDVLQEADTAMYEAKRAPVESGSL